MFNRAKLSIIFANVISPIVFPICIPMYQFVCVLAKKE